MQRYFIQTSSNAPVEGPYTLSQLKQMAVQRKLHPKDRVSIDRKQWVSAGSLPAVIEAVRIAKISAKSNPTLRSSHDGSSKRKPSRQDRFLCERQSRGLDWEVCHAWIGNLLMLALLLTIQLDIVIEILFRINSSTGNCLFVDTVKCVASLIVLILVFGLPLLYERLEVLMANALIGMLAFITAVFFVQINGLVYGILYTGIYFVAVLFLLGVRLILVQTYIPVLFIPLERMVMNHDFAHGIRSIRKDRHIVMALAYLHHLIVYSVILFIIFYFMFAAFMMLLVSEFFAMAYVLRLGIWVIGGLVLFYGLHITADWNALRMMSDRREMPALVWFVLSALIWSIPWVIVSPEAGIAAGVYILLIRIPMVVAWIVMKNRQCNEKGAI